MTFDQALTDHLIAFPALAALIDTRVFPVVVPASESLPALTFQRVSAERVRGMGGAPATVKTRVRLIARAATHAEAKAVTVALRAALDGFEGDLGGPGGVPVQAAQQIDEVDAYDADTTEFRTLADFLCWHDGD